MLKCLKKFKPLKNKIISSNNISGSHIFKYEELFSGILGKIMEAISTSEISLNFYETSAASQKTLIFISSSFPFVCCCSTRWHVLEASKRPARPASTLWTGRRLLQ
jgi:hypothetical protein